MPSRRTVHIVDDDDDVRESASLLLESLGKLPLVEETGGNEDSAELRCW